ncbi:MAG: c-type cytochrome [Aquabacterium sp.]
MSSCPDRGLRRVRAALVALSGLACAVLVSAQTTRYPNVGRDATPREIAAWDIDVRPDFKGLPKGSGSVARGMDVWDAKCASCHGVFGESNEVFHPIVGGTTAKDIETGRVARLTEAGYPGRTTLMKLASVSALWDYINRAMPWTQPKSLSVEEVYAVTAYVLNLGGVVPDDFTLSDRNIAQVQTRLPNRNGMTVDHALWPGRGFGQARPDVRAIACMANCEVDAALGSFLPDHARDAHGNLAEQNRAVGAQKGADTTRPAARSAAATAAVTAAPAASPTPSLAATPAAAATGMSAAAAQALLNKHACVACHGMETKLVGPGFREVARKVAGRPDAAAYLAGRIKAGGSGAWGAVPMPPQTLPESDAKAIAQWLADGMKR